MGSPPAISVLLPVRDAESTLPACLKSVARQRWRDWECLVVDDGSSDASPRIAATVAAADSRFRLIRLEPRGLAPALNAGIDAARGGILARLDADDLMHRERLALQQAALSRQPELVGVGSHVRFFPRAALGAGMREYESWINSLRTDSDVREQAFVECPIAHPSLAIARDTLQRYRYRDRGWPEDYDLLLRLLGDGERIGVVPRRLISWRRLPHRLSATSPSYSIDAFVACKAHHLARTVLRNREHYLLWGYGSTGRKLAAALARQGRHPAGIVEIHPGRLGNTIRGVPVFPCEQLPQWAGYPLVISVAGATARVRIRAALASLDPRPDHVFAA